MTRSSNSCGLWLDVVKKKTDRRRMFGHLPHHILRLASLSQAPLYAETPRRLSAFDWRAVKRRKASRPRAPLPIREETSMKDIVELFTGANLWAWAFIVAAVVIFAAISTHQKKDSAGGKTARR
jgi:hypothetical protein